MNPGHDELILELLKLPKLSQARRDSLQRDLSDGCWKGFLKRSFQEGASGLIFYNLKNNNTRSLLPGWVYNSLQEDYLNNLGRNILIQAQIKEIKGAFRDGGLDLLLVRGAVFFDQLYPCLGIRAMADIDLVIRSRNLPAAQGIFKELGYSWPEDYPFLLSKDDLYIDLHLDVAGFWRIKSWPSPIGINSQEIWDRARPLNSDSTLIRTLDIYDTVINCSDHLQQHSFARLIWFMDIAFLINSKDDFDWSLILSRAKEFNLSKPLYFILSYLDRFGFISLPSGVFDKRPGLSLNRLEQRTLRLLLENKRDDLSGELLFLFLVPGLWPKLGFIREVLFLGKDRLSLPYKRLNFFGYILRLIRIPLYVIAKLLKSFR